MWNCHW